MQKARQLLSIIVNHVWLKPAFVREPIDTSWIIKPEISKTEIEPDEAEIVSDVESDAEEELDTVDRPTTAAFTNPVVADRLKTEIRKPHRFGEWYFEN